MKQNVLLCMGAATLVSMVSCFLPGAEVEPLSTEVLQTVELDLSEGMEVRLNGAGPFRLGLDTGQSAPVILSRALADRLELPLYDQLVVGDGSGEEIREVDVVEIASLQLGDARFERTYALVMDIEGTGSLGFTLFFGCLLTLDLGNDLVRLELGELPEPNGEDVLPLVLHNGFTPGIEVVLAGRGVPALIDSGWHGGVAIPAGLAVLDGQLEIGMHRVEHPELDFDSISPEIVLGDEWLERFEVTFDVRNGRVRLRERRIPPEEGDVRAEELPTCR